MQTDRLELVRLRKEHAPGMLAVWSDPMTTLWSNYGVCSTLEEAEERMSLLLPDEAPTGDNFAILIRRDLDQETINSFKPTTEPNDVFTPGGFVGWIGTWRTEPIAEVGFTLHRSTWGMGFATEAVMGFSSLFWHLKPEIDSLNAFCDVENAASNRVLSKCGFELVGIEYGECELPWMVPSMRDTVQYRLAKGVGLGVSM
ncbi:acyl-CoA N-acyltransferase [Aspergillus ellipticus CBS 707.79]|uniref:Acyl-CoA N-acyltransferase n=1 Tax=Aspergillus ellipticus CBS 707.79 TaxID=1448320 RepID=A0A319D857_9EURO|nr:acyl-CoA N-acyltransferase [Aspergillus ellipticus CBS 707.79]